jgi:hypothetical protein
MALVVCSKAAQFSLHISRPEIPIEVQRLNVPINLAPKIKNLKENKHQFKISLFGEFQ